MYKWYVVHVLSGQEKKVKKAIEDQRDVMGMSEWVDRVILAVENVSEVKKGKQQVAEKKLWPGYLLVRMQFTEDSWSYIKNTPGVLDFLGGGKPVSLTDEEVQEILRDLEDKQRTVTQKHKFQVGDNVKIIDGVFINFIGTVTDVFYDKGRLSVVVSIFGRDTRVDDLEFFQVEAVSEEPTEAP